MSDDQYGKLRVIKGEATPERPEEAPQGEYRREAPPESEAGAWNSDNPTAQDDGFRTFAPSMGRAEQMMTRQLREAREEAEELRRRLRESMGREQRRVNEMDVAARFDQISSGIAAFDAAIGTLAATAPAFAPAGKALSSIIKRLTEEVYPLAVLAATERKPQAEGDGESRIQDFIAQALGEGWNVIPLGRASQDGPNIG